MDEHREGGNDSHRWRVLVWRIARFAFLLALLLFLWPVKYQSTRALFVACLVLTLTGLISRVWNRDHWRRGTLGVLAALTVLMLAPGRAADPVRLRKRYADSLKSFEGVRYVWGGENRWGMDCSGLVRAGLVRALLVEGLLTCNSGLLRTAAWTWWHDSSAAALGSGHLNQTEALTDNVTLNQFDHSWLQPGDLAVTRDGAHVMAYVGDERWVEADPYFGEVVTLVKGGEDPWLHTEVKLNRWRVLK